MRLEVMTNSGVNRVLELMMKKFKGIISFELVGNSYTGKDKLVFFYEYIGNNDDQLYAIESIAKQIPDTEVYLVIDDSYESLTDSSLVVALKEMLARCSNITRFRIVSGNLGLKETCKTVLRYDPVIYFNYHLYCDHFDNFSISQTELKINLNLRNKKFLCVNRHARYHRIRMVDFLLKEKMDKVTHLSCALGQYAKLLDISNGKAIDKTPSEKVHKYLDGGLNTWTPDEKTRERLRSRLPIELDVNEYDHERIRVNMPDLKDYFDDSYITILTEGYWAEKDSLAYTEKVLKCFANAHPFILVGLPHTLKLLRQEGFLTFSSLINEAYDDEEDHEKRLEMIFEEIRRVNSLNIHQIHDAYEYMIPVFRHNFETYKKKNSIAAPVSLADDLIRWYLY